MRYLQCTILQLMLGMLKSLVVDVVCQITSMTSSDNTTAHYYELPTLPTYDTRLLRPFVLWTHSSDAPACKAQSNHLLDWHKPRRFPWPLPSSSSS